MNQKQALIQAISLTDGILEVLDSGNFDRVEDLEAMRQPLIKRAFDESIEQIDLIKAEHLKKLNQQVVSRLTQLRESVLRQQAQFQNASKATRAYQRHSES